MASKSILLLGISLLVVATKVSSYDIEDLKIEVNYAKPPVTAPATPVKPPSTAVPPVVIVPTPPPVKPPTPPLVKAPPPPLVKAPTPPPPPVKAPTSPPPPVKAPTPTPPPQPPVVKPPVAPTPPAAPIVKSKKDCIPLCGYRCKLHSRKGLCMRACVTCCDRCKCVPPGTYGNREKCGKCYTDMLTHGNRPKCP